jgi:mannose-6-phosphate isomerase
MNWIAFQPIYQERVWGGRDLAQLPGRSLPDGQVIGESWEIVDRPEANSVAVGGPFDGRSLRQIIAEAGDRIMGPAWPRDQVFPILVKWLDCQERLSLQVHPPAAMAPALRGEPKTENWYIAAARPDAAVLAGLQPGVTVDQFRAALADNALEPLVCRLACQAGDSLFVPSGRLHAIDAGNLILEIQQNSDTTYRVFDWGRVGLDGKPRQLHIEESMASIDFADCAPQLVRPDGSPRQLLADCPEFLLERHALAAGATLDFAAASGPYILSVVEGAVRDAATGDALSAGANVIIPYSAQCCVLCTEPAIVLVTSRFTN